MERENFYLLLELQLIPPEEDPETILQAIKKKQAEWGKLRNHPTKGIMAKQHIGLVPEIKEVMLDNERRKKEAKNALKELKKKEREKYLTLDRHLAIFLIKGPVTEDEIFRLSKMHSISQEEIQARLKKNEKENFLDFNKRRAVRGSLSGDKLINEIDRQISIRMVNGFLMEEDITKIAKFHSVEVDKVKARIICPVVQKASDAPERPKPLDKSIEKAITENLVVVSKTSLYDFLDLTQGEDLDTIHTAINNKRAEILKAGKKTAMVTASSELAGHCSAVFKDENTRLAYDINMANALLSLLNSDIEASAEDDTICSAYFEVLIKSAAEFGMNEKEAISYIEDYAGKKGWKIKSARKTKRLVIIISIAVVAVLFLSILGAFSAVAIKKNRIKKRFQAVLEEIETKKQLEEKEAVMKAYLKSIDNKVFVFDDAQKKLTKIQIQILKRNKAIEDAYNLLISTSEALTAEQNYEEAVKALSQYMIKYPNSHHLDDIKKKIAEIKAVAEVKEYEALQKAAEEQGADKISIYIEFLNSHPENKYCPEVKKALANLSETYYASIKKQLTANEKKEDWQACFDLCNEFLKIYPDNIKSPEIRGLQYFYKKKLQE